MLCNEDTRYFIIIIFDLGSGKATCKTMIRKTRWSFQKKQKRQEEERL